MNAGSPPLNAALGIYCPFKFTSSDIYHLSVPDSFTGVLFSDSDARCFTQFSRVVSQANT